MNWKLRNRVVEVRYDNGYRYWDQTGLIACALKERFPKLLFEEAGLQYSSFADKENAITLVYGYEASRIRTTSNDAVLATLSDYVKPFFGIVLESIGVQTLTRVGDRSMYDLEFPTEEKAREHFSSVVDKIRVSPNLFSATNDQRLIGKKLKTCSFRLEDESTGLALSLRTDTLTMNVTGPEAAELRKHVTKHRFAFVADLDIFSIKPLAVQDFLPQELLKSNQKMAETRILPVLS